MTYCAVLLGQQSFIDEKTIKIAHRDDSHSFVRIEVEQMRIVGYEIVDAGRDGGS